VNTSSRYWLNFLLAQNSSKGDLFFVTTIPVFSPLSLNLNVTQTQPFNIYFFKKEIFYTKLKYSRVPQFDTSAGAVASFLSGMYGFMVCEKFGFELLDSGDFLFVVIYLVVFSLVVTALVGVFNTTTALFNSFISIFKSMRF
jgi:hypothetical protein